MGEPTWEEDCMKWRGRLLTGEHKHWCWEWDFLPVDETTQEWPCGCPVSDAAEPKETEDG